MPRLFAVVMVVVIASTVEAANPELPEASFEVSDGWLRLRVTRNGQPLEGVNVQCLVGTHVWASGETDSNGCGAFPVPKSDWCQLVFDLGSGPSAPVPLTILSDGKVLPVSSPVRDGTADCCVVPRLKPILEQPPTDSRGLLLGLGLSCCVLVAWLLGRRMTRHSGPTPLKRKQKR